MTGVKDTLSLNQPNREGNYTNSNGYGVVINKKDMPEFEMILIDDLSYISGEKLLDLIILEIQYSLQPLWKMVGIMILIN